MKIKILKDIPDYKCNHIISDDLIFEDRHGMFIRSDNRTHTYYVDALIEDGYAEEVKQIDIEAIRQGNKWCISDWNNAITFYKDLGAKEIEWFSAYRVVSGVIRQLNGDWVADWSDDTQFKRCLVYNHCDRSFKEKGFGGYNASTTQGCILPPCKDSETAQKLIDLCTPELKTLFNIK